MAAEQQGAPTYPVWVGSLSESVREEDLIRLFSKHGAIASCRLMKDKQGRSKKFGYVNFHNRVEAEKAAKKLAGFKIQGLAIKTKGPSVLQEQGHFKTTPSVGANYRPLTDCTFFIQGAICKKGKKCPYRHSEAGRSNASDCPSWLERRCTNLHCPLRHPGAREANKGGDATGSDHSVSPHQLLKCGGQCGDHSCAAHFATAENLLQHIKLDRQFHCSFCQAIFFSEKEYLDHMRGRCRGTRTESGSTDTASQSGESADVEVLSDTESDITSGDYEAEQGEVSDPHSRSPKKQGSQRSLRSAGLGGKSGRSRSTSATSAGSSNTLANGQGDSSPTFRFSSSGYGLGESGPVTMTVGSGSSSGGDSDLQYLDDDDDEEDDVIGYQYSRTEMARLLSLNEQDMTYGSDEEEGGEGEESDGKDEVEVGVEGVSDGRRDSKDLPPHDGEVVKKKPSRRRRSKQKENGGAVKPTHVSARPPHMGRLEPVGLFWDIENCSVPPHKSAFSLANKMRRAFFDGKREAEFMCVCDVTKERKEVTDSLHKAQVTLVHVNAVAKNAADDKLRQSMRRFASTYPPPATVVLVSGDVNFSPELNDLRHVHNFTILLVHNRVASEALKVFAHKCIDYDDFLQDVDAPREPQRSNLSRVLVVSGLPSQAPPPRISSRLDQLSDNCGGKVLSVNPHSGTARLLFRTSEWATKAQKRMTGEDVFGCKITCTLEQPPSHPRQPPQQQPSPPPAHGVPRRLSGHNLSRTYPPGTHPPFQPNPPPPPRSTPSPLLPYPHHHPGPGPGPYPRGPPQPMGMPPPPHMGPFPPSHPLPHPHPPPLRPGFHSPPPLPRAPNHPPVATPPPRPPLMPLLPPPPSTPGRPHGKILIFKIPEREAEDLQRLNSLVMAIRLAACVKAEQLILWHTFSELQVLLRVDFIQTASVRKENMIRTLYERGELRPQMAKQFVDMCSVSITEACQRERVPWEVTTCGWSEDEEQDRITRSQVVELLRLFPHRWCKWGSFKEHFNQRYKSAISEMCIHNACKGAVQILGNPDNPQNQVIVFYELSPLLRVHPHPPALTALQKNLLTLVSSQPEKRVKLLQIVQLYREKFGSLPVSDRGKPLQEVMQDMPSINLVGGKPWTIHVTLVGGVAKDPGTGATNIIARIAAEFRELLSHCPNCTLPLSNIQQAYQTHFHHSFRVSDYLPNTAGARMRDLLEACEGIKMKEEKLPNGKMVAVVYLDQHVHPRFQQPQQWLPHLPQQPPQQQPPQKPPQQQPPQQQPPQQQPPQQQPPQKPPQQQLAQQLAQPAAAAATVAVPAVGQQLSSDMVEQFKQECIVVLTVLPGRGVPIVRFPEVYYKHFGQQFSLVRYGAKKLMQLFQAMPEVVKVTGEKDKFVELIVDTRPDCERRIEALLYSLPNHHVSLDRFMVEYERKFGKKLASYFRHPKLISLLEDMTESLLEIQGAGANRLISLLPVRVLACEMAELLSVQPENSLAINKIVPTYKEKFGRDFVVSSYGYAKLIRALEAIPETLDIQGAGPSRVVHLKENRAIASPTSNSAMPSLSDAPLFCDEVMVILLSTHLHRLSLIELTKRYNTTFRKPSRLPLVGSSQLAEALGKMPTFQLSGAGPTQYVQLVPSSEPSGQDQQKVGENDPLAQTAVGPGNQPNTKPAEGGNELPNLDTASSEHTPTPQPKTKKAKAKTKESPSKGAGPGASDRQVQPPELRFDEKESRRLCSETQRLLLTHQEHAMTLAELVECFRAGEDPAAPSTEELYECLRAYNTKVSGPTKGQKLFQISYIASSEGDSVIQLNQADCLWKLAQDLLYVFVYHPAADFTMPLTDLQATYDKCHGHSFVSAVYAAKNIQQVLRAKHLTKSFKVDQSGTTCMLTEYGQQAVLAQLLAELLFQMGPKCSAVELLPSLYEQYFGVPLLLPSLQVESVAQLLELPEIKAVVQLSKEDENPRPILAPPTRFAEQIRHLFTLHGGRILLSDLEEAFVKEFGKPTDINISGKKLLRHANNVASLAGQQWVVWAPTGRPYPPRPKGVIIASHHTPFSEEGTGLAASSQDVTTMPSEGETNLIDLDTICIPPAVGLQYSNETTEGDQATGSSFSATLLDTPLAGGDPTSVAVIAKLPEGDSDEPQGEDEAPLFASRSVDPQPLADVPVSTVPSLGDHKVDPDAPLVDVQGHSACESDSHPLIEIHNTGSELFCGPVPALMSSYNATSVQVKIDAETYGFLKNELEPELMAELTSNAQSHDLESSFGLHPFGGDGVSAGDQEYIPRGGDTGGKDENLPPGKIDFIDANLTPDEVLQEFHKLKETSGGLLDPEKMEPFLSYFGELSSRELERLESLKPKPKSSSKGGVRKKRMMAIRFPGQSASLPPHPLEEQYRKRMEAINRRLPEAPDLDNLSDSASDDEGGFPKLFNREEAVRMMLEKGLPKIFSSDEDEASSTMKESTGMLASDVQPQPLSGSVVSASDLPRPLITASPSTVAGVLASGTSDVFEWPDLREKSEYSFQSSET